MSKLSQYQAFVAVVEEGSVTAAAARLNLSVPAISKQLSQLEEGLRVQLFLRSHKKLDLSDTGRKFYPKCKAILAAVLQAEEELLSEQENMSGKISVTLSKALCRSKVIDVLAAFSNANPLVNFELHFSDQLEDLYARDIDFAFRLGRLNDSTTMTATSLTNTQLVACATPQYLKKYGVPKSFSDMGEARLIMMSSLNPAGELKTFLNRQRFDFNQSVAHVANDIEGVYQLVEAGVGIGLMLDISVKKEVTEGKFISVLSDRKLPKKRLHLLSKKNQWQNKKHKAFKEYLRAHLSGKQ